MPNYLRIRSTGKGRGQIQFVTLNIFLADKATTAPYEETVLRANPEVMNFQSKGYVTFVTEEEFQAEAKAQEEAAKAAEAAETSPTVEDALDQDNPATAELVRLVNQAQTALNKAFALLTSGAGKQSTPTSAGPKAEAPARESGDDLDLPMNAPQGLKPQVKTQEYLTKTAAERRKYLKECRDVGLLRDAALFETDTKIKALARKAARNAERSAEEAISMAQVSL